MTTRIITRPEGSRTEAEQAIFQAPAKMKYHLHARWKRDGKAGTTWEFEESIGVYGQTYLSDF